MTSLSSGRAGGAPHRRAFLAATAAALAGWALLAAWTPTGGSEDSLCLLRRFLLPCPGCGMTRAAAHLAKGEWALAWAAHPLVYLLASEALTLWLIGGALLLRPASPAGSRRPSDRLVGTWIGIHLVLFVGLWLYRLVTRQLP